MIGGVVLRNIIYNLESRGYNFLDLLEEISITPDDLQKPNFSVSIYQMGHFVEKTVGRLQDNRIGLRMGFESPFSTLGILGQLYQSCDSYIDVLDNMIRHINLIDALSDYSYEIKPDGIYHCRTSNAAWSENYPVAARQAHELYVGLSVRSRRELFGRDIKPLKILTPYPREGENDLLEQYFSCPVVFNAEKMCIVMPLEMLEWKIPTSNPAALLLYKNYIQQILSARSAWTEHARLHISYQLRHTTPSIGLIASLMNLSVRSLQRYLKSEGTTFQELLDEVRYESAKHLLAQKHLSINEVSDLLGFDVQNSFNRFLQKIEGKTPLEFRRELVAGSTK